jgi:site-specific DNA recombinase
MASKAGSSAFLYARVSSQEQQKEGYSIESQLRLLRQYAADNQIEIVEEFIDVETAKRQGRLEFDRMFKLLASSRCKATCVLVEKTDRLYRNIGDWAKLGDLDFETHLVKEGVVLGPDSHSSQKFMHGIRVLMAKNYVDNLSEETSKGMREKAEQGYWPSAAPLGYTNVRHDSGKTRIEPKSDIAPLIRELFVQYGQHKASLGALVKWAVANNLRGKKGGQLHKSSIHHILKNPLYAGKFVWKGTLYEGKDPAIVSWAEFEAVRERMAGTPATRETKREFAFTGLIHCEYCGASVTAEIKKERYIYYHCAQRCRKEKYVSEKRLRELLAALVRPIQIPNGVADWVAQALLASRQDIKRDRQVRLRDARLRYDRLTEKIDLAYEDKLEGKINHSFFQRKQSQWQQEQGRIEAEMERLSEADKTYIETAVQVIELAKRAYDLYIAQTPQEQRLLLNLVLSNCTLADGRLTPTYRKPFDQFVLWPNQVIKENAAPDGSEAARSKWLPLLDSN